MRNKQPWFRPDNNPLIERIQRHKIQKARHENFNLRMFLINKWTGFHHAASTPIDNTGTQPQRTYRAQQRSRKRYLQQLNKILEVIGRFLCAY